MVCNIWNTKKNVIKTSHPSKYNFENHEELTADHVWFCDLFSVGSEKVERARLLIYIGHPQGCPHVINDGVQGAAEEGDPRGELDRPLDLAQEAREVERVAGEDGSELAITFLIGRSRRICSPWDSLDVSPMVAISRGVTRQTNCFEEVGNVKLEQKSGRRYDTAHNSLWCELQESIA